MRTTRLATVASAAAAALLLCTPMAMAATTDPPPTTGPGTAACLDAGFDLGLIKTSHNQAVEADTALSDGEAKIAAVAAAEAFLAGLPTTAVATQEEKDRLSEIPESDPNYVLAQEKIIKITALLKAQADLSTAEDAAAGVDIEVLTAAAESDAAALKVKLDAAEDAEDTACTSPDGDQGNSPAPGGETDGGSADDTSVDDGNVDGQPGATGPVYENCAEVRAAGKAPIKATDTGFATSLDSDHDGIGCETDASTGTSGDGFSQIGKAPVGSADTGQL